MAKNPSRETSHNRWLVCACIFNSLRRLSVDCLFEQTHWCKHMFLQAPFAPLAFQQPIEMLTTKWQNMTTNIADDVNLLRMSFEFQLHDRCNQIFSCFRFICFDCFCCVYRSFDQLLNITMTFCKASQAHKTAATMFSKISSVLAIAAGFTYALVDTRCKLVIRAKHMSLSITDSHA